MEETAQEERTPQKQQSEFGPVAEVGASGSVQAIRHT